MPTPAHHLAADAHPRAVVTIGTFDGVHRGHQALVRRARERAALIGPDVAVTALVFDPNPIEVLRPGQAPARLTTFDQKSDLLREYGADRVVRLEPTAGLLHETPEEFLAIVKRDHGLAGIVEGPDFRFGRGRAGDVRTLQAIGAREGVSVDIVEPVTVALHDHTIVPARSTMVRWLLGHGRVADAALVLGSAPTGRPHTLRGTVVRGDQRGRTIGYPTVNLQSACLAPADGVYAGRARLTDGRVLPAAISVGTKPTFGPHDRAVEAFVMAALDDPRPADLPWDYGWSIDLEFSAFLREQVRYDSLDALLGQVQRDCRRALQIVSLRQATDAPHAQPCAEALT